MSSVVIGMLGTRAKPSASRHCSGASHHQRARPHEARPKAAQPADDFCHGSAHAREQILVDQEIRLDDADGAIVLDNDQIAVVESILQCVFEKFVVTMIFSLL